MNNTVEIFEKIVSKRRSVRIFDKEKPFDRDSVTRSLNRAILSPNSSNMQLWKFYRIQSESAMRKMVSLCLGQGFNHPRP